MKQNELMNILSSKRKGQLIRIQYKTFPKLAAQAERQGIQVMKITETTVRWGVNYSHIAAAIAEQEKRKNNGHLFRPWWHWDIPNVIQKHNTKGTKYFAVYTIPRNNNTRTNYFIISPTGVCEQVSKSDLQNRGLVHNSYWNNKEIPIMFSISLDNIIRIK